MRNKSHAKFTTSKFTPCEIPPPPVACLGVADADRQELKLPSGTFPPSAQPTPGRWLVTEAESAAGTAKPGLGTVALSGLQTAEPNMPDGVLCPRTRPCLSEAKAKARGGRRASRGWRPRCPCPAVQSLMWTDGKNPKVWMQGLC